MTGRSERPLVTRFSVAGSPLPVLLLAGLLGLSACTPTVRVATDEPITINLNVNIKHEILVKVDRELDGLFSKDSGLF